MSLKAIASACAWLTLVAPAFAAFVDPATVTKDDVGPPTPYGETPAEAGAKKIVFDWNYTSRIERAPQRAFETYVSRSYCDHTRLGNDGRRDCVGYEASLASWVARYGSPLRPGELVELNTVASVDGELVTVYGAGVDVFRVHEGRITDHWDASPPAPVRLKAHKPTFLQWLLSERAGPPPYEGPSISGVSVDEQLLSTVDPGPISAYGETASETANKRILFEFNHLSMIVGQPREAFERYVSKDFCDHGHLNTRMQKPCGSYTEQLEHALQFDRPRKVGDTVEIPTMASVSGEMVMMYGAGVDIFRVHDGKVTDHWDASPPADVILQGGPQVDISRATIDVLKSYFGNTLVCAAAITGNDLCHLWLNPDGTFINVDPTGGHAGHYTVGPMTADGKVPICQYWDTPRMVMPPQIPSPIRPPALKSPAAGAAAPPALMCKTVGFKTTCTRVDPANVSAQDRKWVNRGMGERFYGGMCYPLAPKHVGDIWFETDDPLPGQAGKDKLLLLRGRR